MTRSARVLQVLSFLLIAAGSLTCSGDKLILPGEGDPSAISVVAGNNQTGTVGIVLTDSVIVQVTDSKARPVVDARVQFILGTNGTGGDLIPDTAVTDVDGRAGARWVLGTKAGVQLATARVVGFTRVSTSINATAQADVADTVFVLSGDGQTGPVGQALAESLVVRVNDQFGNPVGSIPVGWSVSGGGSVSAPAVATGTNGQAAVERTLGPTAGPQSAAATVPGLNGSPVVFTHTAVAGGPTALLKTDGDNQTAPAGTFLAESVTVQLVDGSSNGVSGRQISFTPSPNNGTASPTSVTTDVNGFAASRWTLGPTAGPQSLIAAGAGFSKTFNATATNDVPTQMAINAGNNQTATAGTAVPVDPSVRVRDVGGNNVPNVSVTFTVTGGGGTVAGPSGSGASTIVATDANGLATLTSWTLGGVAGPNTMSAIASGPSGPLTGSPLLFTSTGNAGPPDHLSITTQPPTTVASGSAFGTTPVIQVRDAGGNPINQANINVTVSLASGSGILNGTKTQPTNSSGQATFSGLSITGLVGPYTLDFNSGSLTGATSSTVNLTPGAANKLFLTTQPSSSAQSGVPFVQQPVVQIVDAAGNSVSQSGTPIDVLIATGGGSLTGTHPVNTDANGTATFTDLAISGAAGGRTLDFTSPGLTKATSTVVTIGAGGATKLGFGVQPTTSTAGSAISPAATVLVQDASGNTVSSATNSVTIALGANPGNSTLSGTLTVNAVNGVATFSDLSLDKVGTGYNLTASAGGLTGATSNNFNITAGTATQLVFTQQPSTVVAGVSISPAVTVTARDAQNNTVTSYTTPIGLTLGNNPGDGNLSGGAAVTPVNGIASFANLSIDSTGNNYTLVAASGALTRISSAFNVNPGAPSQLVFVQQPSNSVAGSSIAPAVKVEIQDALGNTVTSATTSITVAIGTNPPGNGILSGTKTVNAVAGVATLSNLSIDKPGNGYTLTADGGGLPTRISAGFDISVGSGNKLVFTVQPSTAVVGQANTPAIQVQIQDAVGNPVGGTNQITLVSSGPPISGNVVNAVNGVATFNNLKVNSAATGVTLTALASGLLSATSASFDVTAAGTTTTITSDLPDPSVTGRNITVNYTVAVNAPGSGTATGTVTVTDGTVSCQSTVSAGSCQLAPTSAGAKTITATYGGNADFSGSTSAGTAHQVNPASTTTVITPETPDPSVVGQAVTIVYSVSVTAPGNGTPTGNVTVSAGADNCSAPVSAGQCDLTFTSPGAKTITASYPGDGNFNPSQDTEAHTVNKAASTVTITSDLPDPSGAGEAVTVGFTVVASAPGAGTPTGNVVVTVSGSGDTCTGTVAAGSCSLVITTVGANKTITASYNGDANFLANSDTEQHDVTSGATTTTITSTVPSASVVGQPVVIHYSVTPTGGGTPTGTVSVTDGAQSCNASVAAGQCSITFNGAGARTLVATYGGDANFSGSVSAGFGQQVNTASTTTSITADTPDPSTVGQAYTVSYSVGVVAPGGGTPTGSVIVSDGTDTCTGSVAAGSCSLASSTTGSKNLVATYQGDGDYTGSTSAGSSHTVNLAGTTTTITSDSPDPSSIGQAVTVDFTVTSSGGTPTGNVTVSDGVDSCTGTVAAGTCNITLNTSGSRPLTATYAGDANFSGSSSAPAPHTVGVTATTTSITGHTPNPSVVGQPVAVAVSVTGGSTPTGTVTVSDGATNCVATLSGGTGSCNITLGTAGARTLTGTYSGDGSHGGSTSPGVGQTVNQASTSTAITSDTPDPSSIGQAVAVDFSVTVDAPGSGTPTGNVTVSDGVDSCVGTVAAGTCSITLNTNGSRPLTATYAGDANFNGSASAAEPHTVSLTGTTTSITGHTPNPSVVGQPVAVSVTVTGGSTPTGTVTVSDGSTNCIATLAGGSGSCNITLGTAGTRTLTGTYSGDGSHGGSTSPGVGQTVNQASTSTAITSDTPDPSSIGQAVAVDFSVTVDAPGSGTPTGNVTVSDGTDTCVGTVAAGTCNITLNTVGSRPLTATYAGDANFNGSASAAEPHSVALTGTTTTITSHTPSPSVVGQQITVDFTVSGGIGTPTGTVTVSDGTINCNATLSGGSGSCNLTFSSAGTRTLTADYGGDITHGGSTSPGVSHQVNASPTTTTITSHTPDPSVVGQTITVDYTVTAAAPGSGTPVGNVDVSDGTDGCTATVAAGTCQFIATTAGTKTITATYVGNANFATSSDNASHQVNAFGPADPASSTGNVPNGTPGVATIITVQAKDQFGNNVGVGGENVVVTVSGSNSAGPITATDNGDGTYTASYTPASAGPDQVDITMNGTPISGSPFNTTVAVGPAFKMQLFAGDNQSAPVGSQLPVNPSVLVLDSQNNPVSGLAITFAIGSGGGSLSGGNATTNSSGIADVGWTLGTAAGSNTLTATRTGLQGSPVVFSATATPGSTVTTITSDSPDPSEIGQAVTVDFSVAVSAPASGTPSGDVTVSDGVNSCVASVAAGSCNVALLTLGSRPLTASYAGDANFTGSTSGPAAHTVDLLASTTTITSHTPSPSVVGELVVVNVTVTGGLTPTGTVTVSDGTDSCVATLSGGSGTCSVALSSAGTHTLVGTYSGDGFHAGSTSPGVSQTVNPAPTKITITGASPDPSVVGQPVAISFTIVVTGNGGGTPTGDVVITVNDGSGDTCTGTLAAGTCDLVLTTAGNNKTITASYVGSADYLPDTDAAKHNVDPFGPVDPAASTAVVPNGQAGQQTSITIQARDQFGNAVTSGGATVSVTISGANSDTAVVTDNGDGTYTATYTPTNTGTDTIDITINSTPIQGSPFSSTIT